MATVVTVHGTFAHGGGTADALNIGEGVERAWWQTESAFEHEAHELVKAEGGGEIEVKSYVWNADNSELSRREAGSKLLGELRQLEAKGEPYCLVGHSHGGSVIATALVESVARGKPLTNLRKWVTIGTPFVRLRRERFLFTRLSLTRQVLLVASLMLLMMFLFFAAAEFFDGRPHRRDGQLSGLAFSAAMMSIPFFVFYIAMKIADGRELFAYGRRALERARMSYGGLWLPLCHKDDEAVHGLKYLPRVKLHFFERDFAVSRLTMAAIFALPLAYLIALSSPALMTRLADFLRDDVYNVDQFKGTEGQVVAARQDLRGLQRELRKAREEAEQAGLDPARAEAARNRAEDLRSRLREKRRSVQDAIPEFADAERALRFKRRFFETNDGKPCEGGSLCGAGSDYLLNSKLLYHVVTDELSSAVVNDEMRFSAYGGVLRLLVPIVLVPIAFGAVALLVLAILRVVAARLSSLLSRWLNRMTLSEIQRSAFGNDTDGEIAFGAEHCPSWIERKYCHLPDELGDKIAAKSNEFTIQSLGKFRTAISSLAFSENSEAKSDVISSYLTWKELVHTSYFEVPEFRKVIARAISDCAGFVPSDAFRADPDYGRAARWLAELDEKREAAEAAAAAGASPDTAVPGGPRPVAFPA